MGSNGEANKCLQHNRLAIAGVRPGGDKPRRSPNGSCDSF